MIYLTLNNAGIIGGMAYSDADILAYEPAADRWTMVFDGSDLGLTTNLNALTFASDNTLLLSWSQAVTLPGLGLVQSADLVRFSPATLGSTTSGSFSLYFDGSDTGLSDTLSIDAIDLTTSGAIILSFGQDGAVAGISFHDEDLLAFTPTSLGPTTSGSWATFFSGSDVGLDDPGEDLDGTWLTGSSNNIHLSTEGEFNVTGATGDGAGIFLCDATALGNPTSCNFSAYWDGTAHGLDPSSVDGIDICPQPTAITNLSLSANTLLQSTLTWSHSASRFELWWHATQPYFNPGSDCAAASNCALTNASPFIHNHGGGDQFTYIVLAADTCGASRTISPPSNRAGLFRYPIQSGSLNRPNTESFAVY